VKNFKRLKHAPAPKWGSSTVDFTPDRQTNGSSYVLVETFMAHHQGMTIVARQCPRWCAAPLGHARSTRVCGCGAAAGAGTARSIEIA
jgi:hypothetical protein